MRKTLERCGKLTNHPPASLPHSLQHSLLSACSINFNKTHWASAWPDCPTCHVPHLIAFNLATQSATNYTAPNRWQTATSRASFCLIIFINFDLNRLADAPQNFQIETLVTNLRHISLKTLPQKKKIYRNKSE